MSPLIYQEEILKHFKNMLEINSNEEMKKFVQRYIGVEKYSFHQINIFVKLFISQYGKFKAKLRFFENGKDTTEKCIMEFANCTKYFTNGEFTNLLTGIKKPNKKDFLDMISEVYENDLNNNNNYFSSPLIFLIPEKKIYEKLYISEKELNKYKSSKEYLERLKKILDLPYSIESLLSIIEDNNYVIINDNFKKMVLLLYRIKANIPVILMGETGCGKNP